MLTLLSYFALLASLLILTLVLFIGLNKTRIL